MSRLGSSLATLPFSLSPCQIVCPYFIFPVYPNSLVLNLDSIRLHLSSSLTLALHLPSTYLLGWLQARHRVQPSECKCPALRLTRVLSPPLHGHILRSSPRGQPPHLPHSICISDPSGTLDNTVENVEYPNRLYELF